MNNKVTISKVTHQETLFFPLYGRKIANEKYPQVFNDTQAEEIMAKTDYDFSTTKMGSILCIIYGIRQEIMVAGAKEYLKSYPDAVIVNLGCGLDTSFSAVSRL